MDENILIELDYKGIGGRIKELRGTMKQECFAKKFGVLQQDVSKIERAKLKPSHDLLFNLSVFYGKSMDWLLTGQGEMLAPSGQGEAKTTTSDQQSILYPYSLDNKSIHDRVEKVLTVADQSLKEAFIKGLEGVILSMESEKHTNLLNTILLRMDSQDAAINELRLLNASPKKDIAASGS